MNWKQVILSWMTLLALVFASAGASARSDVSPKPHVAGIDLAAALCIGTSGLASVEERLGNRCLSTTVTSDVPHAARGAAGGERAGKAFTLKGKVTVKGDNAAAHAGQTTCVGCGRSTVPAQQSKKGVTPPGNETHVDHIIPKSKGGNGSPDNGQVLCRDCNLDKGAN